jgi:DNA-binding MarR family transcriptional regulator
MGATGETVMLCHRSLPTLGPAHLSSPSPVDTSESLDPLDLTRLTRLLGFRLTRVELRIRRIFVECVQSFDLKPVDFSVLVLVDANPGTNQRLLCEALDVSPPNLAIVIARLVKRRLLRQVRGRQDRRMQHLHLTAAGKALLEQAESRVRQMDAALTDALSKTQSASLLRALDLLARIDVELS